MVGIQKMTNGEKDAVKMRRRKRDESRRLSERE